eukprot:Colp12_sorted_trinity150504_noHs@2839
MDAIAALYSDEEENEQFSSESSKPVKATKDEIVDKAAKVIEKKAKDRDRASSPEKNSNSGKRFLGSPERERRSSISPKRRRSSSRSPRRKEAKPRRSESPRRKNSPSSQRTSGRWDSPQRSSSPPQRSSPSREKSDNTLKRHELPRQSSGRSPSRSKVLDSRDRSPKRRESPPRPRERSPRRRESPSRLNRSPRRNRSPSQRDRSPRRRDSPPNRSSYRPRNDSPQRRGSPSRRRDSPRRDRRRSRSKSRSPRRRMNEPRARKSRSRSPRNRESRSKTPEAGSSADDMPFVPHAKAPKPQRASLPGIKVGSEFTINKPPPSRSEQIASEKRKLLWGSKKTESASAASRRKNAWRLHGASDMVSSLLLTNHSYPIGLPLHTCFWKLFRLCFMLNDFDFCHYVFAFVMLSLARLYACSNIYHQTGVFALNLPWRSDLQSHDSVLSSWLPLLFLLLLVSHQQLPSRLRHRPQTSGRLPLLMAQVATSVTSSSSLWE